MLHYQKRHSLVAKRSNAQKVYVPANARENQYLLLSFRPSYELVSQLTQQLTDDYGLFYQILSQQFFELCEAHGLHNTHVIANQKLARVRFNEEQQIIETAEQLLFFYNPGYHTGHHSFVEKSQLAEKIDFLILSTGENVRENAHYFHQQTIELLNDLAKRFAIPLSEFKIKDHQHLTYDIYAPERGDRQTKTHGLRDLSFRYQQQSLELPIDFNRQTYAIANLPMTLRLSKTVEYETNSEPCYGRLYQRIADEFDAIAKKYELSKVAFLANGKAPIVRLANDNNVLLGKELNYLYFDLQKESSSMLGAWQNDELTDTLYLVFCADEVALYRNSYAKFVNQLTLAVKELCLTLGYEPQKDVVMLRFFQHLSYQLT